ncbi:MAG: hypothetical protein AB8B95_07890 [Pseudohongiellaceae bacterium]
MKLATNKLSGGLIVAALVFINPQIVNAQKPALESVYPDLNALMAAHEILHARIFEEIDATNDSPTSTIGKRLLVEAIVELAEAAGSHYHSSNSHLAMLGPHRVFESRATPGLVTLIRRERDVEAAATAFADVELLPDVAVKTLERGRSFIFEVMEIYLNDNVSDKETAINEAVAVYLSDDTHSVASQPKSEELLSEHPAAYAYRVGFPQFSGLTWASQWLKIAVLEIAATSPDRESLYQDIAYALGTYEEKITRLHGSLVSLPSDIPGIPVVAPNFYTFHPEASAIIDNIEALKVVIGDILAHPEEEDRASAIEAMVAQYTSKTDHLIDNMDYMIFVLRGGIYGAGGPARGGMTQPDRNYSRDVQENPHVSKYPMAQ